MFSGGKVLECVTSVSPNKITKEAAAVPISKCRSGGCRGKSHNGISFLANVEDKYSDWTDVYVLAQKIFQASRHNTITRDHRVKGKLNKTDIKVIASLS